MHLKGVIRVELYQLGDSHIGSCVHVCYSPSDSVLSIKQKLQLLTGIPALSQILSHATTQLSDSDTLHSLSISRNAIPTLHMHVPIRGGASRQSTGFQPFMFKDVTKEECFEKLSFPASGPSYCIIAKGLSFQAYCTNPMCVSVRAGHCVYVSKGMYPDQNGYVSIRREVFSLQCPACYCKIPAENWKNIVFTDCTAEIEWILVDNRQGATTLVTEKGKYTQAKQCVQIIEYHTLDVKLK